MPSFMGVSIVGFDTLACEAIRLFVLKLPVTTGDMAALGGSFGGKTLAGPGVFFGT